MTAGLDGGQNRMLNLDLHNHRPLREIVYEELAEFDYYNYTSK